MAIKIACNKIGSGKVLRLSDLRFAWFFLIAMAVASLIGCPAIDPDRQAKITGMVQKIAAVNTVCGSAVGVAGTEPEQWRNYLELKNFANPAELTTLTDNPIPAVRVYAFQALVAYDPSTAFGVLIRHLSDKEQVATQFGCIGSDQSVADLFFANYDFFGNDQGQAENAGSRLLSKEQRLTLEKELLFNENIRMWARTEFLADLGPIPANYARIREIALNEHNSGAIITLAKYKNSNDLEIIERFLVDSELSTSAVKAVAEFPHPSFVATLTKLFDREWQDKLYDYPLWENLLIALAKYQRPEIAQKFSQIAKCPDEFRHKTLGEFLVSAIKASGTSYYDSLLPELRFNANE